MTIIETTWTPVCTVSQLTPDRGAAAMVDGRQVAVFLLSTGDVRAVDNRDPFSGANVLSRGLVGDSAGRTYVASPVYKQRFCLDTGACLDDDATRVSVHDVRVVAGRVEVRPSI